MKKIIILLVVLAVSVILYSANAQTKFVLPANLTKGNFSGNGSGNTALKTSFIFSSSSIAPFNTDTSDSWSVSWVDYDNDGYDDLFYTNKDGVHPNLLYRNLGNGTFKKITNSLLVQTISTASTATWADVDNDGDLDVFIANDTRFFNSLFLNDGKGNFTLNINSGLSNLVGYYQGAAFADYDKDGFVDLYVGNYMPTRFNELYHNNGNGTFSKVTNTPITMQQGNGVGATWADYDNDGFPDLFVPNNHQLTNMLYHNLGNGQFAAVTNSPIVQDGGASVASCWGDIDGDGDLDLFVANSNVAFGNYLYRNDGAGKFTKITNSILSNGGHSHGCNFIDVDNDGDLDLMVCNDVGVKFLYINDGTGNFTAKTDEPVNVDYGYSFANSWSDFDRDGDMDVAVATHSNQKNFLFTNNTNSNNKNTWVSIKLVGNYSNKSGIGTRIKICTSGKKQILEVNAQSGFGGQNSLWNHFGLGSASVIDSIIIYWPSNVQQVILKSCVNKFMTINEMSSTNVSGMIYQDANNNCTKDANENGIGNIKLLITPGNIIATTDNNGKYSVQLNNGSYTISPKLTSTWQNGCTASYKITIKNCTSANNINFGLKAANQGADLFASVSSTAMRRGFKNQLVMEYGNMGSQTSCTDTLKLTLDNNLVVFSATIPWSFKKDNSFYWVVKNLTAGQIFTVYLNDSISRNVNIGTLISLSTTISGHCNELNMANNKFNFSQKTVGAIDPNEMQVFVKQNDNTEYVSKTDTLHYRISFQNVGNYEATNVMITNQIPDGLDASTFQQGMSSSHYQVSISGNTITWIFDSIQLPDSSMNQAASNGFVEFTLQPTNNVAAGDIILNSAQIQFDYENPLETNRVSNVIKNEAADNHFMQLYPNPSNSFINMQLDNSISEEATNIVSYSIFNLKGQLMLNVQNQSATLQHVDIGSFQSGWYIVEALDEKGKTHQAKFIKQ